MTKNGDFWNIFIPENFDKTLAEFNEEDSIVYNKTKEDSYLIKFGDWNNSNF